MTKHEPIDPSADGIEQGKRLIRVDADRGHSLAQRIAEGFQRLTWRTPLHKLRLRGRFPLKLLAAPDDPIVGDLKVGQALLQGWITWRGERIAVRELNFAALQGSPGMVEYLHSFAWLRDLSTAGTRQQGAPVAEAIMSRWLAAHAEHVGGLAWRADLWGKRILYWTAHAPLILSSRDLVYRSAVLNTLARGARHLDRAADKAPEGLGRVAAWGGLIAAGLLIPGGDPRRAFAEAGLARALGQSFGEDGGIACRSPSALLDAIGLLSLLRAAYDARRQDPLPAIDETLARAVPALLGVTHGDGGLASWQGGLPFDQARIAATIEASRVRARPLRQARQWGYQRLAGGATTVSMDAAPPPASRAASGGCASTLAFEMSDGPHRLVVSCGGARNPGAMLPANLAEALRATAAHSALIVADANSTAVHPDGSLGRGVVEVEIDRQELESGSRIEASHDGYVRRYGLVHRRQLALSVDGRQLSGEDMLLPAGRRKRAAPFAIRFHLAPEVEVTLTADSQGALLRIDDGPLWQFRCKGGVLSTEESLWVDATGRPRETQQLVVTGESPAGGANVSWLFKRAG
ncbi:heparinase [Sphingomonas sp. MAH-20]|uniref:Heparinase n=1 Tax=Sphingomonas horti TaxID=2682842 RepID=A0A6I4J4R4_9SPHN|nr:MULTISPECIES: heparinase II/III family protein [Sphingomonas]MBA2921105.1 heparinase II/III family protein [Sphingomonas sp. CGMCC 1.13658]MVO79347.1 heparinase [Sphingomonas horti]